MITLDSNIIILIANGKLRQPNFSSRKLACSVISKVETLGFHNITMQEAIEIGLMFDNMVVLPLNETTASLAIKLRQQKRMSLGDAIIAATALEYDCELWTANDKDFEHIEGLRLHNPLAKG